MPHKSKLPVTVNENPDKEKFIGEALFFKNSCSVCKNQNPYRLNCCMAFPDGIPKDILSGKVSHEDAVDGDHGIRFEPKGR